MQRASAAFALFDVFPKSHVLFHHCDVICILWEGSVGGEAKSDGCGFCDGMFTGNPVR